MGQAAGSTPTTILIRRQKVMASFLAFLVKFVISYPSWRELIFRWTAELVHGDDFDVDQWNGPLFAQRCVLLRSRTVCLNVLDKLGPVKS